MQIKLSVFLSAALIGCLASPAQADTSIAIANGDFQLPNLGAGVEGGSGNVPGWVTSGYNDVYSTNAWPLTGPGTPAQGLFQATGQSAYQMLTGINSTYVEGAVYTFTVNQIGCYGGDVTFTMALRDAATHTNLSALSTATPTITGVTALTMYLTPISLSYTATAADAGKTIEVYLNAVTYLLYDNVTLSAVLPDSDGDGLPDAWEMAKAGNLTDLNGLGTGPGPGAGTGDFDGDGLLDIDERIAGTDPTNTDTDFDGLNDGAEVHGTAGLRPPTSPVLTDTDGDGLSDLAETNTGTYVSPTNTGTNPTLADTDGDRYSDGIEVNTLHSNPNIPSDPTSTSIAIANGNFENPALSGNEGGNGNVPNWVTSGGYNNIFKSTTWPITGAGTPSQILIQSAGSGVSQVLTGANNTYVEGAVYALAVNIGAFDAANTTFTLSLRRADTHANVAAVTTIGNVPVHTMQTAPVSLNYTATATDAGQTIEVCLTATTNLAYDNVILSAVLPDSDGDGLPDSWEMAKAENLTDLNGLGVGPGPGAGTGDFDGDGLLDIDEYTAGSDPTNTDTDFDGLNDGAEVRGTAGSRPATSPLLADTDGDGLSDLAETNTGTYVSPTNTGTNPTLADTDADDYSDGFEVNTLLTNPLDAGDPPFSAALCGQWTFETGSELVDVTGNFPALTLQGDATVSGGALNLNGSGVTSTGWASTGTGGTAMTSKTLVSWITLQSLSGVASQGAAISLAQDAQFDGIVFAEKDTNRWMNGSTNWLRTGAGQFNQAEAVESTTGTMIMLAITYQDLGGGQVRITGYRNGIQIGTYDSANSVSWAANNQIVLFGPRIGTTGALDALVHEARLYNKAATAAQIMALNDTDGDGLPDSWEMSKAGNLTDLNGLGVGPGPGAGTGDFDGDGLLDKDEYTAGTDPTNTDTDFDGLNDGAEVHGTAGLRPPTSPLLTDTDGDGLSDLAETNTGTYLNPTNTGTNPALADTDGDRYTDDIELNTLHSNPFLALDPPSPYFANGDFQLPVLVGLEGGSGNVPGWVTSGYNNVFNTNAWPLTGPGTPAQGLFQATGQSAYQMLTGTNSTYVEGAVYTFTVNQIGCYGGDVTFTMALRDAATHLDLSALSTATPTITGVAEKTMYLTPISLSYTATAADAGKQIEVYLSAVTYLLYDNVTLTAVLPSANAFDTWATTTHGLSGPAAAFDADPDKDGIPNGIEFVIGGEPNPANPNSNSSALLFAPDASGDNLVYTYTLMNAAAYLNPFVEFDADLQGEWTTAEDGVNATIMVTPGDPAATVTVTIPKNGRSTLFARLKVIQP